jgi:hypothetical protein
VHNSQGQAPGPLGGLGLHQIVTFPSGKHLAARSYWGLVARVNLIRKVASLTLVLDLIWGRVSRKIAPSELTRMAGAGL